MLGFPRCEPKRFFFGGEGLPDPFDPGTTTDDGILGITGANVVTGAVEVTDRRNTGGALVVGCAGGGA